MTLKSLVDRQMMTFESGLYPARDGGPGVSPRENFEIWDAIWCNLVHFGKKLTFFQFSTFVNENIVIVLDSGIDIIIILFFADECPLFLVVAEG